MESKFLALSKSHDNLQIQLTKELSRVTLMPIDTIPCATNPICEHGDLIEENKRLKATIDKGIATCIQGKKNLDDLLSNQRDNVSKEEIVGSPPRKRTTRRRTRRRVL